MENYYFTQAKHSLYLLLIGFLWVSVTQAQVIDYGSEADIIEANGDIDITAVVDLDLFPLTEDYSVTWKENHTTTRRSGVILHTSGANTANTQDGGITVTSTDMTDSTTLSATFACSAVGTANGLTSPQLSWTGGAGAPTHYAIIMHDDFNGNAVYDAGFDWAHWVVYNIPAATTNIAQGDTSLTEGINSWGEFMGGAMPGEDRYRGPCPPTGTHTYYFTVYGYTGGTIMPAATGPFGQITGGDVLTAINSNITDQGDLQVDFSNADIVAPVSTPLIYDFEADTIGATPANITEANGTIETVAGQAAEIQTIGTGNTAVFDLDLFPSETDYSVTWKENYATTPGKTAVVLRGSGVSTATTGLEQGYLFMASGQQSTMRLFRVNAGSLTEFGSGAALTPQGIGVDRWYRATVNGTTLTFDYSDDGVNFTNSKTQTDATYTTGTTQLTEGWGNGVGRVEFDDITFKELDFTLSETDLTIDENAGADTFTVVLDKQPATDVVIDLSSDDTGEATVAPATLTFTNANWDTPQVVTVTGVDDGVLINDTAVITASINDAGSDDDFDAALDQTVTITLTDDDAGILILSETDLTINENAGADTFTVKLDRAPATDVVVDLSSDDTGEATVAPTSLTFTNANWDTAQTVTVTGVDDAVVADHIATITASVNDAGSDDSFDPALDQTVNITLTDDEIVTLIYDFEADTIGATPGNITETNGAIETVAGQAVEVTSDGGSGTAAFDLDLFVPSANYSVTWKENYTTARRTGVTLRGTTLEGNGLRHGYLFQSNSALNDLRIYSFDGGYTQLGGSFSLTAPGVGVDRWYRATVNGTNLTFAYSNDGVNFIDAMTRTDATHVAGTTQLMQGYGFGVGNSEIDDIEFVGGAVSAVSVDNISEYQVFQRDGANQADIAISGTYFGTPAAIEASFNGGAFATIDAAPAGNTFTGILNDQPAGQGTLTVRFTDDTGITDDVANVGVGDIFVIAGQSNHSGRGNSNQVYTHGTLKATLFGNDDNWKELTDPFDSSSGQIDGVSSDNPTGSHIPLLATQIMADQGVPVAFIPAAKGGTRIAQWQPGADHKNPATLFGSMSRRIDAVGGNVRAVLFYQGESDVADGTNYATYTAGLTTLVNTIAADYPGTPTLVGQIGYSNLAKDIIREAQSDLPPVNANALLGAITYDINLADESGDALHFKSNGDLADFADRWWNAVSVGVYGNVIDTAPRIVEWGITYDTIANTVDVLFDTDLSGVLPTTAAFSIATTGGTPTIDSVSLLPDNRTVRLQLTGGVATGLDITYASDNTATDNALYSLNTGIPAIPFFDEPAPLPGFTLSQSTLTINENGGTDTFTVVLDAQPATDVVIDISSDDTGEATVAPATLTFTSLDWNTPQPVTVTGINDAIIANHSAVITMSINDAASDDDFDALADQTVDITLTDDESVTFIYDFEADTIGLVPANITEANGTIETVAGQGAEIISAAAGNTAVFDLDLFPSETDYSVTWKENYTTARRSGVILRGSGANTAVTGLKQGYLFQVNPGLMGGIVNIWRSNASGFSKLGTDIALAPPGVGVDRWYRATAVGTDLTLAWSADGINFTDVITQTDATYTTGTSQLTQGFASGIGGVTYDDITFKAPPVDFALSETTLTIAENAGVDTFTVVLNAQPATDVVIDLSSDDTNEATVTPATLTFTPGDWDTPQPVTVTGVNDAINADHTAIITASVNDAASDDGFDTLADKTVNITLTDDEPVTFIYDFEADTIGLVPANITEANGTIETVAGQGAEIISAAAGNTAVFDLDLFPSETDYSVTWKENYTTARRSGVILRGSGVNTAATGLKQGYLFQVNPGVMGGIVNIWRSNTSGFSKLGTDIALAPPGVGVDRWYRATAVGTDLTLAWSADGVNFTDVITQTDVTYTTGTTQLTQGYGTGQGGVTFDDITFKAPPGLGFTLSETALTIDENAGEDTFTVVLDVQPATDVVINLSSDDTNEANVTPATLTFTNLDWDTPQPVTVTGVDDVVKVNHTAIITASVNDATSDDGFDTLADKTVDVTLTNDDIPFGSLNYVSVGAYDLSIATFNSVALSAANTQTALPISSLFNDDGTVFYVLDFVTDEINKFNLATAYDVSSATFNSVALDVTGQEIDPTSMIFNSDGTILYITGIEGNDFNQYNLGTPYNISTATFDSSVLNIVGQDNRNFSTLFNDDGSILYVLGRTGNDVNQYNLITPYDISTATFDSIVLSVAGQETTPTSMLFNDDGTRLYVTGIVGDDINQYDLGTPYDISTATFNSIVLNVAGQEVDPRTMIFNNNGSRLYLLGNTGQDVNQYDVGYTTYPEAVANDGAIDNSNPLTIELTGETFTGANGSDLVTDGKVTLGNIPAGLTAVLTKDSDTQATLTFTGTSNDHENADDVASFTFEFADSAFTGNDASDVANSGFGVVYDSNIGIDFEDNPQVTLITLAEDSAVLLQWDEVATATDYIIEYKESAAGGWTTATDGVSTARGYTITGLTNGTAYDFRVIPVALGAVVSDVVTETPSAVSNVTSVINQFLGTGQSLSIGSGGAPQLSTTQPFSNRMLNGGATALIPLVEPVTFGNAGVETKTSGFANALSNTVPGFESIVTLNGVGGTAYTGLKKGTTPYANGINRIQSAFDLVSAEGDPYKVQAVTVVHGESDEVADTPTATYEANLVEWQNDYETDIQAITGQTGTIPLFTDQISAWPAAGNATPKAGLAQWLAAKNNPDKIYLVTPLYIFDYVDSYHMRNYSYRRLGEYYAKAVEKVVVDGEPWLPLSPQEITRTDDTILAKFNVPVEPLVFDTTKVGAAANNGFEYYDDTSSATITSTTLVDTNNNGLADAVEITLSGVPTGGDQQLRYAYTGAGNNTGRFGTNSIKGNLRDSDATPAYYQDGNVPANMGNELNNWSVTFSELITEVGFTLSETDLTINENTGEGTFTVVLDSQPTTNVVIDIASDDTNEATVSPTSLTFTPSDWDTAQIVTVTGVDDGVEADHTAIITASVNDALSADDFDILADQTVDITLTDDETPPSPGGVAADLDLWLKADDNGSTITDGATVGSWTDRSPNIDSPTAAGTPSYEDDATSAINFNPIVRYAGNDRHNPSTPFNSPNLTFYLVANPTGNGSFRTLLRGGSHLPILLNRGSTEIGLYSGRFRGSGLHWNNGETALLKTIQSNPANVSVFSKNSSADAVMTTRTTAAPIYIGNNTRGQAFGDVAEFIAYNNNAQSATKAVQIESYLALKYGITIDQAVATDYLASDGITEMWDADFPTANIYNNDIAGIGRDDASALGQIKSRSQNDDGVVTILAEGESTDDSNTSANYNFTDLDDLEFVTWGNNNGTFDQITTGLPAGVASRIERIWQAQETGELGTTAVTFDVDAIGINAEAAAGFVLLQDTDTDFTDATQTFGATLVGGEVTFTGVDLNHGDLFTLGALPPTIGDLIWADYNANGVFDAGTEVGLDNVTVELYLDDGASVGTYDGDETLHLATTTGAGGVYSFVGLTPQEYWVVVSDDNGVLNGAALTSTPVLPELVEAAPGMTYDTADYGFGVYTASIAALSDGSEASDDVEFTVSLDRANASGGDLDITYSYSGGSATAGTDYDNSTTTITIPNGANSATLSVPVTDDAVDEDDESVEVTLISADSPVHIENDGTQKASADITDDDTVGYALSETALTIDEDGLTGATGSFTVVLTSEPSSNVVIDIASDDINEATVSPTSLTFTPSDWDTAQPVTVTGVDDAIDADHSATITASVNPSSDDTYDLLADQTVTVTLTNDDAVGFTLSQTVSTVAEAGGTDTFTVVLDSEPTSDVIIDLSSNDTNEATVSPSSLTFTSTNWNMTQEVTITGVNDNIDADHSATITAAVNAAGSDNAYDPLADQTVTVTLTDDDAVGFKLSKTTSTVAENGGTDTFTIVLDSEPTSDVVIDLSSNDTNEATVSGSLTFTSVNWSTPQTVTITGVNDNIDANHSATITATVNAAGSDNAYDPLADQTVTVTLTNDDAVGFTLSKTTSTVSENGGTDTFTIVLDSEPTSDVVIDLSSNDTNEATVSGSLTFTSVNWSTPQTVTITGVNDNIDANHSATITATVNAAGSDNAYDPLADQTVTVTLTNDDAVGFTLSKTTSTVSENGGTDTFTIVLDSEPTSDVVIDLSSNDTNEATVSGSLTFTSVNWSTAQTVTITGVNDNIDANHSATITATVNAAGSDNAYDPLADQTVTVTLTNDDAVGFTLSKTTSTVSENGGTDTFTIVLDSEPTSDVVIDLSSNDTNEATVSGSLTFTSVNWSTPQTVTITGVNDNIDADHSATITATVNAAGSDNAYDPLADQTVTVTLTNDDAVADIIKPNVTINQKTGTPDPSTIDTFGTFTVVFDEAIDPATFTAADVDTTTATATGITVNSVLEVAPNDGTTFEVQISVTGNGNIIATIPAEGIEDLAGNTNTVSTSTDNSVTIDVNNNTQISFLVYPNPVEEILTVQLKSKNHIDKIKVDIYDVIGKLVLSSTESPNSKDKLKINISRFSTGVYNLVLTTDSNRKFQKRIVKK